eukprot:TRINITY_DN13640_c0_g1_i1.p1 TRINITY_DN13640_c0_g1~~TRINITY_DN13640_c0_g1_i1.p1  ORF type:complete len:233 (-),score=28.88 TRINITY_DN13640_c0_g1_i1:532-1161(-)
MALALPDELWQEICFHMPIADVLSLSETASRFRCLAREEFLWERLCSRDLQATVLHAESWRDMYISWCQQLSGIFYYTSNGWTLDCDNSTFAATVHCRPTAPGVAWQKKLPRPPFVAELIISVGTSAPFYMFDLGCVPGSPYAKWPRLKRPMLLIASSVYNQKFLMLRELAQRDEVLKWCTACDVLEQALALMRPVCDKLAIHGDIDKF